MPAITAADRVGALFLSTTGQPHGAARKAEHHASSLASTSQPQDKRFLLLLLEEGAGELKGTLPRDNTDHDQGSSLTRLFDLSTAVVVLWSCRGRIAGITASACAALFLYPVAIVPVLNSIFLGIAGGGI